MDRDPALRSAPVVPYSGTARFFHWLTVLLVAFQIPVGIYMVRRGKATDFDGLTNTLYSGHKLAGVVILAVVVLRLLYRLAHGAPPDEPTLETWQKGAAHANHWSLYLMLLVTPLLGWYALSLYGALDVFNWFSLPALAAKNADASTRWFLLHWYAALAIVGLVAMHVGAALYHYVIRGDGVLSRMLPGVGRRNG